MPTKLLFMLALAFLCGMALATMWALAIVALADREPDAPFETCVDPQPFEDVLNDEIDVEAGEWIDLRGRR